VGEVGELSPRGSILRFSDALNLPDKILYEDQLRGIGGAQLVLAKVSRLLLTVLGAETHLFDVTRDELGHFKHGDLALAVEHGLQGRIGIDERLLGGVLEFVLFDVIPELLGHLATG